MRPFASLLLFSLGILACGRGVAPGGPADAGPVDAGPFIPGFDPPPVAAGYTRYITPVVQIPPSSSDIWCQYVAPAFTADTDVVNVTGQQSLYGHHIVVYATTTQAPVGTSRLCTTSDMLSVRFLGAIGGEGNGSIAHVLPEGVVFRVNKGEELMLNTHFLDATAQGAEGQGVVDVKFETPSASDQVAGFFTNLNSKFQLAAATPSPQSADATCTVQRDFNFFAFADHMHQLGYSAYTEVIDAQGAKTYLVQDKVWNPELMFNPTFALWPISAPMTVHMGDKIHTHCEWIDDGSSAVAFPIEMCVGFGFYLPGGGPEIDCIDDQWPSPSN